MKHLFVPTLVLFFAFLLPGCGPEEENTTNSNTNSSQTNSSNNANDGPFDAEAFGWGLHVVGRNAADIYVAGGAPDRGKLLHFDGSAWIEQTLPEGTPLLNWVHLFEGGQAVAVGNAGTVLAFDGETWTAEPTATDQDLWGVWGADPSDVWTVGGAGRAEGDATIVRRSNNVWNVEEPPTLQRPGVNAWFKVWGSDAEDVWIVGQRGGILHWDGEALSEHGAGTAEDLIAVSGTGADNVWAVGGRANGVVAWWDGSNWTSQSISPAPGVNGLWIQDESTIWLAGVNGLLRPATVIENGVEVPRIPPSTTLDLHAVTGFSGYGLLAVGGNFSQPQGPYIGVALLRELP